MTDVVRTPAFCTQCRSRCGCVAVVSDNRLTGIEPLPEHPSGARLCPKGKAAPELVYDANRLTQPMQRTKPKGSADAGWEPISWDCALDTITERMGAIRDDHGAEQVAFSITTPSGTHMSDGISWVERLVRAFGSPNTIYGTEICNWHKDVATRFTYGHDIGTPDFANTDCVLLWGTNPANTWLARTVEIQKSIRNGAKMIVVDPRRTSLARQADCWLRVKPGTDQALALGLANLQIEQNQFDIEFIQHWSNGPLLVRDDNGLLLRQNDLQGDGAAHILLALNSDNNSLLRYDSLAGTWLDSPDNADLRASAELSGTTGRIACRTGFSYFAQAAAEYPPARVAKITGVSEASQRAAAKILSDASSVAYYAWNGVGQSPTATQTDRAISVLYAMTGHYGSPGGNIPGGAASFNDLSGLDLLTKPQRAKALGLTERPLGPGLNGWVTARDVYHAVLNQDPYPIRMLVSFGTNLLVSQPDTARAHRALKALEFHVHADFSLNPSAQYADIVLPVSTSWEREGLRNGFDASLEGMRRVQLRPAVIPPVGESRSDIDIVLGLASRLGMDDQFFDGDVNAGYRHVLKPSGVTLEALRENPEGVTLPQSVLPRPFEALTPNGAPIGFPTPTKKLEIYSEHLHRHGQAAVPTLSLNDLPQPEQNFPLRLSGAKIMAYCHSQHRHIASLRRLQPDPMLEISETAATHRKIANRDWVTIRTKQGSFIARAKINKDLEPDSVFAQHGWWVKTQEDDSTDDFVTLPNNSNAAIDTTNCDPISGSIALRCSGVKSRSHRQLNNMTLAARDRSNGETLLLAGCHIARTIQRCHQRH